ncbi:Cytoplasmic polyadenylation element-binding protein 4 [Camelus dromedarius]|uniref:Cytoplasmic polyadenylation element-binding protein 4 n=1 Tax=Camelus dromedarius TaxID=9838 RepID=A0A5N4CM19_CAMDR|nr:Cytoplasmic polyadenylation element-binding protein 4 [Camelus dromedarius]
MGPCQGSAVCCRLPSKECSLLLYCHSTSLKCLEPSGESQSSLFPMEDGFLDDGRGDQPLHSGLGSPHCFTHQNGERVERYSRKVFVGGLPPDIDEGIFTKSRV